MIAQLRARIHAALIGDLVPADQPTTRWDYITPPEHGKR